MTVSINHVTRLANSICSWSSLPDIGCELKIAWSHQTLKITIDWHTPNCHFWYGSFIWKWKTVILSQKNTVLKRCWHTRIDFICIPSSDVTTNKIETLKSIVLYDACILCEMNSLVPVRCVCNLQLVIFELIPRIHILWIQCDISLGSML